MSKPDLVWGSYLLAVALGFAILEHAALSQHKKGLTLSATLRRWLGVHPAREWGAFSRWMFSTTMLSTTAWIIYHILLEGISDDEPERRA